MPAVAGVDLGGTAINYTLLDQQETFLIEGLCEHPALAKQGPEVCLQQIADGLKVAAQKAGVSLDDVVAVGLDTPRPASAAVRIGAARALAKISETHRIKLVMGAESEGETVEPSRSFLKPQIKSRSGRILKNRE